MCRMLLLLITVFSLGGCVGFYSEIYVPPEDPSLTQGEPLLSDTCLKEVIVDFREGAGAGKESAAALFQSNPSQDKPAHSDLARHNPGWHNPAQRNPAQDNTRDIFDIDHRMVLGIDRFQEALDRTLRESNLFTSHGPRSVVLHADILGYDIGCMDPTLTMVFRVNYRLQDDGGTILFEKEITSESKNDRDLIFAYDRLVRSQTLGYVKNIQALRSGLRETLTEYAKERERVRKQERLRLEEERIRKAKLAQMEADPYPAAQSDRVSGVPPMKSSGPHERWALVVGIGNYGDPEIAQIPEAAEDAMAVHDFLLSPDGGGFEADHVFLLIDKNATKLNLERFLKRELKINVLKEDELFIYFACHGVALPDTQKKSDDGHEKFLVPYDTHNSEIDLFGLSMGDFERYLDDIDCRQVAVVLDTCFSGGARSLCMGPTTRNTTLTSDFLQNLASGNHHKERKILTACNGSELALDDPESGHGVFTTYFLEALKRAEDMDGNGSVSLFEVYRHLYRPVQKRSSELGQRQHPQWVGLPSVPFVMKKQ